MRKLLFVALTLFSVSAAARNLIVEEYGGVWYVQNLQVATITIDSFTPDNSDGGALVVSSNKSINASRPVCVVAHADGAAPTSGEDVCEHPQALEFPAGTADINHLTAGFSGRLTVSQLAQGGYAAPITTSLFSITGATATAIDFRPSFNITIPVGNNNRNLPLADLITADIADFQNSAVCQGGAGTEHIRNFQLKYEFAQFFPSLSEAALAKAYSRIEGTLDWLNAANCNGLKRTANVFIRMKTASGEQLANVQNFVPTDFHNQPVSQGGVFWVRSNGRHHFNLLWTDQTAPLVVKTRAAFRGLMERIGDHPSLEMMIIAESAPTQGYNTAITDAGLPYSFSAKSAGMIDFATHVCEPAPTKQCFFALNYFGINANTTAKVDSERVEFDVFLNAMTARPGFGVMFPDYWPRSSTENPKSAPLGYYARNTGEVGTFVSAQQNGNKYDTVAQLLPSALDTWSYALCNNVDRYSSLNDVNGGQCSPLANYLTLRNFGSETIADAISAVSTYGAIPNTTCPTNYGTCNSAY